MNGTIYLNREMEPPVNQEPKLDQGAEPSLTQKMELHLNYIWTRASGKTMSELASGTLSES